MSQTPLPAADADRRAETRATLLLWAFIALYVLVCTPLGYYRMWVIHRSSVDSAQLMQLLWTTVNGHGVLWSPTFAQNYLAQNFCPIILALVPLYWVLPHFGALVFVQTAAIALCAWPAYRIARGRLSDPAAALMIAMTTVLYPTVLSQNFFQWIPHILGLPFILTALYCFERRWFWRFVICSALALTGKETFAFPIFIFAAAAVWQRRPWRWVVASLLLSVGFLSFYFLWLSPALRDDGPLHASLYLKYLGDTPGEALGALLRNPLRVFETPFKPHKVAYTFLLLAPLGMIVPLLGWPALLALPDYLVNLISASYSFIVIRHHYGTVIGVFLCAAAGYGVRRIADRLSARWGPGRYERLVAAGVLLACIAGAPNGFNYSEWDPYPNAAMLREAMAMIPPEASVFCTEDLMVHVAARLNVCDNTTAEWRYGRGRVYEMATRFDYVLLNTFAQAVPAEWRTWAGQLLTDPSFECVYRDKHDSALLFRRKSGGLMKNFWRGNP